MKVRGIELTLHENEALSNHIRRERDFFEAPILDYLAEHYPSHHTIIDVGANLGNHTVYFANFLKYDAIVAFEPISSSYALLLSNIRHYENILALHAAVGDSEGFVSMMEKHDNMGASKVIDGGPKNIPITTIDHFKFINVTLMKIDVEEYEPQVLVGAKETIAKWHPLILIEDWTYGTYAKLLPGYVLEKAWDEEFTYLYRWQG